MELGAGERVAGGLSGVSLPGVRSAPRLLDDQASFSKVLSRENHRVRQSPEAKARDAAEQFVSLALLQPIFKQMREAQTAPPPFGASNAEKQFRALMDAEIAQRMVKRANWTLVDRVAESLLKKSTPAAAFAPSSIEDSHGV